MSGPLLWIIAHDSYRMNYSGLMEKTWNLSHLQIVIMIFPLDRQSTVVRHWPPDRIRVQVLAMWKLKYMISKMTSGMMRRIILMPGFKFFYTIPLDFLGISLKYYSVESYVTRVRVIVSKLFFAEEENDFEASCRASNLWPLHVNLEVESRSPQETGDFTQMLEKDGIKDKILSKNDLDHSLLQRELSKIL